MFSPLKNYCKTKRKYKLIQDYFFETSIIKRLRIFGPFNIVILNCSFNSFSCPGVNLVLFTQFVFLNIYYDKILSSGTIMLTTYYTYLA